MKKISLWMILLLIYISCGGCGSGSSSGGGSSFQQQIVFAGDSLTAQGSWSLDFGIPIDNRGVEGLESWQLVDNIAGYVAQKPNKIFIMIGINDVLHGNPGDVVGSISSIIDKIRVVSPATIIYIQSILPVQGYDNRAIIEGLNIQIQSLSNTKGVGFIFLYSLFKDGSNDINWVYYRDGLHLTTAGYQVWENAIRGYIYSNFSKTRS